MVFFQHEYKMNIKSILIWSTAVGALVFVMLLVFPSMSKELDNMQEMYANLGALSSMFNLETLQMGNIMGYYGIEAGSILSIGGGMFAAILGAGMLAKEEAYHTTEYIYITPNTRIYFLNQKLLAIVGLIVTYNLLCFAWSLLGFAIIGESIVWNKLLLLHLSQFFMELEIAAICFGISAFLKKLNIGLGIGIALLLYFLHLLGNITASVEKVHYITPFYYSDAATVYEDTSIPLVYVLIGLGITIVSILVAYLRYTKKDLSV